MTTRFVEIEVTGTPREIGRAVGEGARDLVVEAVGFYEQYHHEMGPMTFAEAETAVLEYLPAARACVPSAVAELEGIAEGSGVPLTKLLVPNLGEELTCNDDPAGQPPGVALSHADAEHRRSQGHCTTLAIMAGGRHVVAHNEDWFAGDADKNVVLRATTTDGTRVVTVTSAALLGATGINSHGIAGGANTVFASDHRVGVPNNLLRRWIIESPTLDEARRRCLVDERARGSNHLFGDASGHILDIETTGTTSAWVEADGWYAHTNHYVLPGMATFELSHSVNSRARLERAGTIIADGLARGDDARIIAARVLADHENGANCVCGHPNEDDSYGAQEMTTASMIWDLDELTVDVAFGPPCKNERLRFAV